MTSEQSILAVELKNSTIPSVFFSHRQHYWHLHELLSRVCLTHFMFINRFFPLIARTDIKRETEKSPPKYSNESFWTRIHTQKLF